VTGREVSGLGLGLYISRQIVEQHDGTLYATSKSGEGSTFIMELPLET
jgi:two-component system, sensor histidine kinase